MRIAVIGGGAAGMATAYYLDKQGHYVMVFERQPILGGHIRTLNKNVKPSHFVCNEVLCNEILESGPLEFPNAFHNFVALMKELNVNLIPISVGSALFPKDGKPFLSEVAITKNFKGIQRLIEYLRFDSVYARSAGLWLKTRLTEVQDFYNQPLSQYLKDEYTGNLWLKLLTMYSYSIPFEFIDDFPAQLAIPMLRDYLAVEWFRVEGGVYSYIEKILERFSGDIELGIEISKISRGSNSIKIERSQGEIEEFDKVVFATPPDQVMALLADPTDAEIKRFSKWKGNHISTTVHTDTSMYDRHSIRHPSEFDFFQTETCWGYNGCLNQLCGITTSPQHYFLSFQLEELIAKECIVHIQEHHTPLYTTDSFLHRDEIVVTNGENNTYHAGAYLGDGLHEGAISSAIQVAKLVG